MELDEQLELLPRDLDLREDGRRRADPRVHRPAIAWVAAMGPTRGSAKVYIDGVARRDRQPVPQRSRVPAGRVRVQLADERHPPITIVVAGTAGRPRVDLDALVGDPLGERKPEPVAHARSRLMAGWYVRAPDRRGGAGSRTRPSARARNGRHDRGTFDVEGGDPVRARDDPGEAVHRDRVRLRDPLQHAPRDGPVPDPDEGLVPRGREGHLARRHGQGLRVRARPVRRDHGRGPREGPAQDRPLDRDRAVRAQGRDDPHARPVHEAGVLHRARQDRPQGVLPHAPGAARQGAHGDLQGRDP